jgi:hypothetical protein
VLEAMAAGWKRHRFCRIVVLAWLACEPVPIDQVRRALRSYRDSPGRVRDERQEALRLANRLAGGPGMSRVARRRFIDAFTNALRGEPIDRGALSSPAFDPGGVGPLLLPAALSSTAAILFLNAWQAGGAALNWADDELFHEARNLCRTVDRLITDNQEMIDRCLGADSTALLRENACACVLLAIGVLHLLGLPESGGLATEIAELQNGKSARRLRQQPRATTHGAETSECDPRVPRRTRPASS